MTGQVITPSVASSMSQEKGRNGSLGAAPPALFFALSDLIAFALTHVSLLAGVALLPAGVISGAIYADPTSPESLTAIGLFAIVFFATIALAGLYHSRSWEVDEIARVAASIGVAMIAASVFESGYGFGDAPWIALLTWGVLVGLVISVRMVVRAIGVVRNAMGAPLIMIGRGMTSTELHAQLKESRAFKSEIVAQYGVADFLRLLGDAPRLGVVGTAQSFGYDMRNVTFVLVPEPDEMVDVADLLENLYEADASYMVAVPFYGLARRTVTLRKVTGGDVVFADVPARRSTGISALAKRLMDIGVAGGALLALSPVLLVIAGLLALERGPLFFKQTRVGRNRSRFPCFKFRSMVPDAEARLARYLEENPEAKREWETYQKLTNDPRVTWIGRFLRKSSMDELPQLLNVLRGEMSIVGPRPIVAPEVKGYEQDHAYYHSDDFDDYARMRPGITGLWQVSGRASTTHAERVRLDRWYARNWSIWLDVVILLKTVRAAALGTGSS